MNNRTITLKAKRVLLAAATALTLVAAACSSKNPVTPTPDQPSLLSAQLTKLVTDTKVPGAIGVVCSHDSILDLKAAGVRRAGYAPHIGTSDLMHMGSLGKLITSTMIAKLVDEGGLNWTSRPADVIPGLAGLVDSGYANITLLDLLRHRAGAPGDEDLDSIPDFTGSLKDQRLEVTRTILALPPAVRPGVFRYSNVGYVIAACMAEAVTGLDWRSLMESRLFQPLGIEVVYGWPTSHDADEPWGHLLSGTGFVPVPPTIEPAYWAIAEPAGGMSMTLSDYSKFIQLYLDALNGHPRLLSAAAFQTLITPVDDYACGVKIIHTADGLVLWHNGSNDYFYTVLYVYPEHDLAMAVGINAGDKSLWLPTGSAAEAVLSKFLKQ